MEFLTDRCRFLLGAPYETSTKSITKRLQAHISYKGRLFKKKDALKKSHAKEMVSEGNEIVKDELVA